MKTFLRALRAVGVVLALCITLARAQEAQTLPLVMTLEGYPAAYSPDGSKIVTGYWDNTAKVWDASSKKLLNTLKSHTSLVFSPTFSPDGSKILTASGDKTAKIWDA